MAKRRRPLWQELILLAVTAIVLSVVVKTFFAQSFYVPSASMEPTLRGDSQAQDRIVTQKISYWSGDPERGDVVVFKDPGNWLDSARTTPTALQRSLGAIGMRPSDQHLVKRVIGRAGDRVVCCDAKGRLEVNGDAVSEPYLFDQSSTRDQRFDVTVPSDRLWVMGDNRGDSADSRAHRDGPGHGFVPVEDVVGKVWLVVWPWKDRAVLHDPVGRSG